MSARKQLKEDDCFTNPRQFWQVENPFSGHSHIGPFLFIALPCLLLITWRKKPQHEVYIKESILKLHSVSCLGTENMFVVNPI